MAQPLWKILWQFIKKLNINLPLTQQFHWSYIPKRIENMIHRKILLCLILATLI